MVIILFGKIGGEMVKLHLGCGERDFGKDWVHIDGGDFDHLDSHSITNLDYNKHSVDLIYASHVIEYFDRDEVRELLKEWHRVLKPGAVLRLAVPDFEALTKLYLGGVATLENILGPLYGKWPMGSETIYHKTTYDERSLKDLLREIGFKKLSRYDWKDTSHNEYDDHSQAYMCPNGDRKKGTLVSLNIQGTKV